MGFAAGLAFIAAVSAYDGYLTWLYAPIDELFPPSAWLLRHYGTGGFLAAKALGTAAVLATLCILDRIVQRWTLVILPALCLCQAALLAFLLLG